MLLEKGKEDPDAKRRDGLTLLWYAVRARHFSLVDCLISRYGANINSPDNDGKTPVLWASDQGEMDILKILLERFNASPHSKSNSGHSAFDYAFLARRLDIMEYLVQKHGLPVENTTLDERSAFSWAMGWDYPVEIWNFLLQNGAMLNSKDKGGRSPLWYAVCKHREEAVEFLLDQSELESAPLEDIPGESWRYWEHFCPEIHERLQPFIPLEEDVDLDEKRSQMQWSWSIVP